jgi:hypothetical protein
MFMVVAFAALIAALGILTFGVIIAMEQRRSRGQLPPRPAPGGNALPS